MEEKIMNTETQIMEAAKKVFLEKGFDGTRMQNIADVAQINKSLLHYYYRSKEKLFDAVFNDTFSKFVPQVLGILNNELPLREKFILFAKAYSKMFFENPFIPSFILHELNRHPEKIVSYIKQGGTLKNSAEIPKVFFDQINKEIEQGNIRPMAPCQIIVNLLSLTIFPFVARPIIEGVILNFANIEYNSFINERIDLIPSIMMESLKPVV
ncbi:MAG: TetR/AcrR family transcriptional regulator [Lentimicrobiaceae bacterium]|jgi:AcrR family transcriptional regulator|nr:TetR/AcrR family transcriptional regulator [Lentimicrobiaceae bacterium]